MIPSTERIQALLESFGPNAGLVEELLEEYLNNPSSVSESWQTFFSRFLNGSSQTAHEMRTSLARAGASGTVLRAGP